MDPDITHEEDLEAEGTVHGEDIVPEVALFPSDDPQEEVDESPERKSDKEIAVEVMEGKWGNNIDRRQRLVAAGYDPNAIKRAIVKLLN